MPGLHLRRTIHFTAVLLVKVAHLLLIRRGDRCHFGKHLLRRQFAAGVLGITGLVEAGIVELACKHIGATHCLARFLDLLSYHRIADHYVSLDGFLPEQFLVNQGIQRLQP